MSVIVRNTRNGSMYILLGTSFSYYKDSRPGIFGGNLIPHEEEGEFKMAAVCNSQGDIEWFPTDDLKVIEIDGAQISSQLEKITEDYNKNRRIYYCPACGSNVYEDDEICTSCGITLIVDEDNLPEF
jgi:predicted RNA-binding Zn-ribbon protein involved in translation (DUF1610 family)